MKNQSAFSATACWIFLNAFSACFSKIKVSVILIMMKMEEVKKTGPLTSSPKIDFFSSLRVTFLAINYFLIKSSIQY